MRGLLLLAFVLATALLTTGCSLLGDCGRDRQHCVGDDCTCGEACNGDEDCDGSDVCAFYDRAPNHGACVEVEYAERHQLGVFAQDPGTNNAPNNRNNTPTNNANNIGTNNDGGGSCDFGTDCASGLCCGGNGACVSAAIACPDSLSCVDGSISSNCFGACEADRNCASGWFCNESTSRCALGCTSDSDCSGEETCEPDGRCAGSTVETCSAHGESCDPSMPGGGEFFCSEEGICLAHCDRAQTASDCPTGHYCWDVGPENACIASTCTTNAECANGGTCVDFDNDFSICTDRGGPIAEGDPCEPSNNECMPGTICREINATSGVCSRFCDPWLTNPGCPAGEVCAEYFTPRTFFCTNVTTTSGTEPYDSCVAAPAACGDGVQCLPTSAGDACHAFCRPESDDCGTVPDGRPGRCNPHMIGGNDAIGFCAPDCTPTGCSGPNAICVDGVCANECTPGNETIDCCNGEQPCSYECDPDTHLCR